MAAASSEVVGSSQFESLIFGKGEEKKHLVAMVLTDSLKKSDKFSRELAYKPLKPGANPTIVSYKAGAVKNYNVTGSLMRFGNKNIFFYSRKPLAYYIGTTLALYTIVNSKVWLQEWGKSAPRKVDFVVGNFFN
jgi:hypothetical protein